MADLTLWVGGYPATVIAPHTPPTWETLADGGCGAASFALALSARSQHQALRAGSLVRIMCGAAPVYAGVLTEPDRTTWECHAVGLSGELRGYLALSAGATTRDLMAAIATAIAEGWQGSNPAPVSGTAAGDATGNPVSVGTLLDDYAEQTGQRWGTDGWGALYMTPGQVAPTWLASPDAAAFGPTSEGAPRRLAGRYDAGGGIFDTAFAGTGAPQEAVDLTGRGPLTPTAATAILAGALTRAGETGWVNSVSLHREQLTTLGGTPAFLPMVRAGQVMRAHGLSYGIAFQRPWLDVTIGKTTYTAGSETITVEPVNTAPRGLADVIAAA